MAQTTQRRRIIGNPGSRPGASARKKTKKRSQNNTGEILGFTLANPGRKVAKKHMAHTTKKSKKNATRRGGHKAAKHNPARRHTTSHRRRSVRRNVGGGTGGIAPLVTNAVFVILGALGSKVGAQAVLGQKNTGLMGYAANAGVGAGLWFLTEKVMKNRAASSGVIAGTVVQILLRAINDYTPFGQYVNQLGMGDYQMQSFVTPQVLVDPTNSAEIKIPGGWAPRMIAPPPPPVAAGMSGLYGHQGSRGNIYGG